MSDCSAIDTLGWVNRNMIKQRTLKTIVRATGVGVHTGDKVYLTLRPAPANTGIVFRRIDLTPAVEIPAKAAYIGDTSLSTCLINGDTKISTVEHLLSAMAGLGIDNAYIDLTSPELPIMDGSSGPFVFLIQSAGVEEQKALKKFIRIKKRVVVEAPDGEPNGKRKKKNKRIELAPYNGFKVNFEIDFDHPNFDKKNQSAVLDFSSTSYVRDVARARTFGFLAQYEYLRKNNLARGASLDNVVVIDDFKVVNQDGLRFDDEFVRHKILDVVGDMYLLGYSLIGAVSGYKSGHALNSQLLNALLADESAYEIVTFDDPQELPITFGPVAEPVVA